jgi:stage III sporulation protein AE
LPEAVFTESDSESIAAVWERLLSPRALGELVLEEVVAHRRVYFGLLLELLGILLVRAVWNCLAGTVRSSGIGSGIRTLCRLCLFGVIAAQALGMLEGVVAFYRDLGTLSTAFLPLMGSMYAMGGNVGAAVSNQSTLVMSLSLVEWLGGKSIVPLVSLCLAFSLLGVFESSVSGRMQVLTGKLKQWYTTALSLVMLLLSGALAAQTTLASRADSLGFRTVRFAVSSNIPVVGVGVAEMLRTAATGISWLRGVVGVGGIVLLLWLLLPRIVSLLLYRLVYSVAADLALWMGCEEEGRMFSEIGSLQGYLLAVISVSVMTFFFALIILLRCGAAFGG